MPDNPYFSKRQVSQQAHNLLHHINNGIYALQEAAKILDSLVLQNARKFRKRDDRKRKATKKATKASKR